MYTASLTNKIPEAGKIRFVVTFTDGADSFTKEIIQDVGSINHEEIKRQVARVLTDLNTPPDIPTGAIGSPTAPPATPQAEIDRNQWLKDWNNLKGANQLIAAGIIADTLPAYTTLKNKVIADFKNSYVTYL